MKFFNIYFKLIYAVFLYIFYFSCYFAMESTTKISKQGEQLQEVQKKVKALQEKYYLILPKNRNIKNEIWYLYKEEILAKDVSHLENENKKLKVIQKQLESTIGYLEAMDILDNPVWRRTKENATLREIKTILKNQYEENKKMQYLNISLLDKLVERNKDCEQIGTKQIKKVQKGEKLMEQLKEAELSSGQEEISTLQRRIIEIAQSKKVLKQRMEELQKKKEKQLYWPKYL